MLINCAASYQKRPYIPYIVPFVIFGICIYVGPLLNISQGVIYAIKTVLVAASLIYFWNAYNRK